MFLFVLFVGSGTALTAQELHYTKTPSGYVMVLHPGDSLFHCIEQLAVRENIPSATLTAIGFVHVRFGFFKKGSKTYKQKTFKHVELVSFSGSLAWKNGNPSIHAHAIAANSRYKTYGGHVMDAVVSTGSVELTLVVHDKKLERKKNEALGAEVLQVGNR